MSSTARDRIFARLHAARTTVSPYVPRGGSWQAPMLDKDQRIELLKKRMETVRSEVHVVPEAEWPAKLLEVLKAREPQTMAYGHDAWFGGTLRSKVKGKGLPKLVPYGENVEAFRDELFGIDVGITSTLGGIAENGTLIVWPTPQEPRLLSYALGREHAHQRAAHLRPVQDGGHRDDPGLRGAWAQGSDRAGAGLAENTHHT